MAGRFGDELRGIFLWREKRGGVMTDRDLVPYLGRGFIGGTGETRDVA